MFHNGDKIGLDLQELEIPELPSAYGMDQPSAPAKTRNLPQPEFDQLFADGWSSLSPSSVINIFQNPEALVDEPPVEMETKQNNNKRRRAKRQEQTPENATDEHKASQKKAGKKSRTRQTVAPDTSSHTEPDEAMSFTTSANRSSFRDLHIDLIEATSMGFQIENARLKTENAMLQTEIQTTRDQNHLLPVDLVKQNAEQKKEIMRLRTQNMSLQLRLQQVTGQPCSALASSYLNYTSGNESPFSPSGFFNNSPETNILDSSENVTTPIPVNNM